MVAMDKFKWIIFAVICIGLLAVLVLTNKRPSSNYSGEVTQPITGGTIADHVSGSAENKVVLIEYGDFQCPACLNAYPTLKELKEQYKDKLTFVFRNLPLTNVHPNALAAATAAEAAGLQGKFYEMHDALYEQQSLWRDKDVNQRGAAFEQIAASIGLDAAKYKEDLGSPAVTEKINRDRSTAGQIGANSTPTFLLNGQKLSEIPAEELKTKVEDELKKAGLL